MASEDGLDQEPSDIFMKKAAVDHSKHVYVQCNPHTAKYTRCISKIAVILIACYWMMVAEKAWKTVTFKHIL